jgi:hypothetical protein
MPSETIAAQNERLAKFTCRMEQNERGSIRQFFLAQAPSFPADSLEAFILKTLAKKSNYSTITQE